MGQRQFFSRDGVRLSYVDFGGPADRTLVCLHGRSGSARNFAPLAQVLKDDWRVVAADLRGHGWSDHSTDGSRDAFIADAAALITHLARTPGCGPVALLGHSLGGVTAYQTAARHPQLVRRLIVEDIGCRFGPPVAEESWPLRWDTLDRFLAFMQTTPLGMNRLLLDNLVEYEDGWGFRFSDENYRPVREALTGDWSADFAAVACPVLLVHGTASWAVTRAEIDRMAALNPRCELAVIEGAGHVPHDEQPAAFTAALRGFLDRPGA
jgi:esterase